MPAPSAKCRPRSDLLLEHEGSRPSNERARLLAWVFVQHCWM
jgi:hypothetical protein